MFVRLLAMLFLSVLTLASWAKPSEHTIAEFPQNFPYRAFDTRDSLGRDIRFYLSDADITDDRPLILVVQGSGCASHFSNLLSARSRGWLYPIASRIGPPYR